MRSSFQSGRAALLVFLTLVAAGCRGEDPLPQRLKERLASVFDAGAKDPTPDELRQALVRQLRVAPGTVPSRETINDFYAQHGHRLIWSDGSGKAAPATTTLLEALRRAEDHGLNPAEYASERLDALAKQIGEGGSDERAAATLADFDLLLTTAFFRYASDVSTGRVHPDEVQKDWHTNPPELDLAKALDEALARNNLATLLESLPPPHPGYARLRQSLRNLREVEAAGGWPTIPPGPKLASGSTGPRVAMLRRRLSESAAAPSERFDAALATSVRGFQSAHGIEPDGVVSDDTLAELNVPAGERIRQVELNLERWRWIPRDLGDPHVIVNIPGYDLELARKDEEPWRTRVVAGKVYTPTPVFSDRIVAIVVNPPWNVPESIAKGEFLPELQENPGTFARKGIRILEGSGEKAREVDPRRVKWSDVDPEHFPYRFRQDPGKENPLGRVKFDLTNEFHVYLHDTPAGGVFSRTDRDLSHGCIRVENALDLANQIASEASKEKISEALEQPEERRIPLDSKIRVHLLYWTAWTDKVGNLHFVPDVYGFDKTQRAALDRVASHPDRITRHSKNKAGGA